eukprot:TRINITY_DN8301_c0_g1_i15.p1 TRINITY_DN8301_c0_g1~~TRINITY_DN8301_c0_g1_i15.p1  ORF type:complete len:375 (-),score=127.11 TRINITY_DN8301_c0_g1_i15:74-1198(-)
MCIRDRASPEYREKAHPTVLVNVLNYFLKRKTLYLIAKNNKEISEVIDYLLKEDVFSKLPDNYFVTLGMILDSSDVRDEKAWEKIIEKILNAREKYNLKTLGKALVLTIKLQSKKVWKGCEKAQSQLVEEITKKLEKEEFDPTAVIAILNAYRGKTKAPEELSKLLEKLVRKNIESIGPSIFSELFNKMTFAYQMSNDFFDDCKEKISKILQEIPFINRKTPSKDDIDPKYFIMLVMGLGKKGALDKETIQKIEARILENKDKLIPKDIITLYTCLTKNKRIHNPVDSFKFINGWIAENIKAIDEGMISKLLLDWKEKDCSLEKEVKEKVKEAVNEMLKRERNMRKDTLRMVYRALDEDLPKDIAEKIRKLLKL